MVLPQRMTQRCWAVMALGLRVDHAFRIARVTHVQIRKIPNAPGQVNLVFRIFGQNYPK